jgi:hypothetical protein
MTASTEASTAARSAHTKMPDFFIVGHPKCGTTALYEMLRSHPQIFMPELKEPWFFAHDMRPRWQPPRQAPTPQNLPDYLALFAAARADQRAGEASSTYLLSTDAAGHIAGLLPDARIIAILREPASFLRSLHQQLLRTHVESRKRLGDAIALEPARRQGKRIPRRSHRPQLLMYSEHCRYAEQLRRYHEVFPREQVLVLIYDDFRADNEATVRTVRRFLGVDDAPPVEVSDANPSTISMRSQHVDELLNRVSVGRDPVSRVVKAGVKAVLPGELRRRAIGATQRHLVMGPPPPPEEEVMVGLRRRFKDEVVALGDLLDRDLVTLWGYDGID